MILTCPACATRYRVREHDLAAPAGRMVRCANCGQVWRQAPPPAEMRGDQAIAIGASSPADPVLEAAPRPVAAPELEIPRRPRPALPPTLPTTTDQVRPWWATLGRAIATILVLVVLAVLALIFARRHVATIWPAAGGLYASIGLPVEAAGSGLAIEQIAPVRTADGLMIHGEIANPGSRALDVPRLRVALRNAAEQEVQLEIVDPPKARLQPGEIVHFAAPFAHPADEATGVVVTFASR
ncbi:MAG: DUF3426 domain-containing protein [Stellaceae bacterium]